MITKTNYVDFIFCNRSYYYFLNNKNEAKETDDAAQKRIDEGKLINDWAHKYFSNTVLVKKDQDFVDINLQIELTKKLLDSDAIAEASFKYEDLFCAVDLLVNNKDGTYDIYEVKASTDIKKHLKEYLPDVAFQKYVLTRCGITVKNCYILHLNNKYVRNGNVEVNKLLIPYDLSSDPLFETFYQSVPDQLIMMRRLQSSKSLPEYGNCSRDCPFFAFCHKHIEKPNILELNGIRLNKAHDLIENGIITLKDIKDSDEIKLNLRQQLQIDNNIDPSLNPFINKQKLREFLGQLKYPIYHLDFETMNEAVPPFDGTSPYQQIPFQYSLHIESNPGSNLIHKEFLADKLDSEYELAKQLCNDIPKGVTSMAYNMSFEKSVIKHLAKRFPELSDHLMDIKNNLVDLIEPFKQAYYYDNNQGGSNSIKYVMPALVPDMNQAYHNLPVVHNGGEALAMFPKMLKMSGQERLETRKGMLQYCELDTLSMVKVLNKLWEQSK